MSSEPQRPSPAPRVVRLDLPFDAGFDAAFPPAPDGAVLRVCAMAWPPAQIDGALASAHVYQASSAKDELPPRWQVNAALLARCPDLLCVSTYGAGYDTVDVAACTRAGVAVVNQTGSNADSVAEHTLGLVLGLSKCIAACDRRLRGGEGFARHAYSGVELRGRTLGLVGIGHAGTRVAALAAAFGMQAIAHDPYVADDEVLRRGARPVPMNALLREADVVSLHCPLDASTAGMFGAAQFAALKQGCLFISTARGGIHDEAALADALRSGHLGGAGLDVWQAEPPPSSHPLLALDNVLATYHIAGVTLEARRRMAAMAAQQVLGLLAGNRPPRLVNPEVWPHFAQRFEELLGRTLRD
jgi:D-3-phosphoglycerate dehydrogenase